MAEAFGYPSRKPRRRAVAAALEGVASSTAQKWRGFLWPGADILSVKPSIERPPAIYPAHSRVIAAQRAIATLRERAR
jgi:hypothetical protein